jgi:hypothetical protein
MAQTLAERLEMGRRSRFVGRTAERDKFRSALAAVEWPFQLLHLFGPGGVGKTTLLREFVNMAQKAGVTAVYVDGRHFEPSPAFFLHTLARAMNLPAAENVVDYLAGVIGRSLIVVDTYEVLTPLDNWLRDAFLPQLPTQVLVILGSRNPPALAWRTDPGWQEVMQVWPLRNLSPEEGRAFLMRRQIPAKEHTAVLNFTHGHPLALSLVADAFAHQPDLPFNPADAPDVIKTLVDRLVENVPDGLHRQALEACAQVRLLTEPLLAAMLSTDDVHDLFNWLYSLSFIDADRHGIFPHDLAREALTADLRWRNPQWFAELQHRARNYYVAHVQKGEAREQRQLLVQYIYLLRDNPIIRPYFEWQVSGSVFTDKMRPDDKAPLLDMVAQHEGAESAQIMAHWLGSPAATVTILRQTAKEPQGVLLQVAVAQTTAAERAEDPAVAAAWDFLAQHAPLQLGDQATFFRFWLARDSYQAVSPVQSRIFLYMVQHYLATPGLAYTFLPCAEPDFWLQVFTYARLTRLPQVEFVVGGRQYGVYGHDWRLEPPIPWLNKIGEQELPQLGTATGAVPVLGGEEFKTAVRQALRDYVNLEALQDNPLLRSRLVPGKAASTAEQVDALREMLVEAAVTLQHNPKQVKFYRALHHTYFQPAATQEQAAELLDLPFSTYRRYLKTAVDHIIHSLWRQETGTTSH